MRIIFCCRDDPSSKYIANLLFEHDLLDGILIECGRLARRKKIKRLLNKPVWRYPVIFLDLLALVIYSRLWQRQVKMFLKEKGIKKYPSGIERKSVQSINSSESRSFLRAFQPEIMVIYGTSILTEETIVIPDKYLLNIHTGIVPEYRNVHSDFWAYTRGDLKNLGTTIIHLNEGIDSGDIAFQGKVKTTYSDGFWFAKRKNLELAGDLILKALKDSGTELPRKPQGKEAVGYFRTPKFSDLLSFFYNELRKK